MLQQRLATSTEGMAMEDILVDMAAIEDMDISERDLLMLKLSQDTLAEGMEVMAMVVSAMVVMVVFMDVDTTARERLKQ